MTDPYEAYDPYRPYETGPHPRPERRQPASWGATIASALAPTVVAAVVLVGAIAQAPSAMGSGDGPARPGPAGSSTPAPSPSPAPTGPGAPHAAKPDAADLGKDNTLYAAAMPDRTTCPGFRARTDELTAAELKPYLDSLLDCLMVMHAEPLKARGIQVRRPALKAENDMAGSRCRGDEELNDWAGVYCAPDVTIYYRLDTKKYSALEHQLVMTHEFAHHLQKEARILDAATDQRDGDKAANELLERRVELQAACMSGSMLAGSWSPLRIRNADWSAYLQSMGQVPEAWRPSHGSGPAQQTWSQASVKNKVAYAGCNTWRAAPAEVE